MKILQIINSHALQDGGAQRLALELHRAFRARGHDAHLLSLMRSPTDEVGTYSLGFPTPYRTRVGPRLRQFLAQPRWKNLDVIHVHLFPAQIWVPLVMPRALRRIPLVTTEHNTFNRRRESRLGRLLDGATLRFYQRIICISPATSEALSQWQPQIDNRLITIPNGIDLGRYANFPTRDSANSKRIVLAVGRIAEQKNYETAIRAVAQTRADFEFWIAGQDEMNGQMQKLSAELGQTERIRFLGFQADIPALLARADVFLLTSKWEGFGLAVAEAMAAGLPVIASDVPGVREVVGRDENCGFLVDPGAPAEVAARLELLLKDETQRRAMGEAAQNRAAQFDIENTIASHLALYRTVSG
ncbi:MAG TPA: glycosyltransferase family 4 protein [Abditibacterium sp.]|jgi:glycosyltransferase involved in cell wall biosynthesis